MSAMAAKQAFFFNLWPSLTYQLQLTIAMAAKNLATTSKINSADYIN